MKDKIYQRVMRIAGMTWCGDDHAAPEARTLRYTNAEQRDRVIASKNDGFELWLGSPTKWDCYLRQHEVRLLLRWIVVDWYAKARWFGLRRPIYYWALHQHLECWRRDQKVTR